MGTNYYQRTDICPCCNRYKEKHIGKNSGGWDFTFQGYNFVESQPKISSWEDWKRELKDNGKIFDEYGRELSFDEFVAFVEENHNGSFKDRPNLNHYDYCVEKKEANDDTETSINCKIGDFQVLGDFLLNQIGYTHNNEEDRHAN